MPDTITLILSESRPGDTQQQQLVDALADGLMLRPQIDLTIVPHLYDLDSDGPTAEFLHEIEGPMIVISWLYPRAAFWTLKNAGIAGGRGDDDKASGEQRLIWCLGLHTGMEIQAVLDDVDRIVEGDHRDLQTVATDRVEPARRSEATRERWYPVIDRDRCTSCLECLNFCLFGVYGMDSTDDILIEQPDACRPGCPACSRICPEGAIMFPQHADPAISGDDKASLEGLKLDLSQLFSGADASALALAERDHALSQAEVKPKPAGADQLDDLVDELDEMDI